MTNDRLKILLGCLLATAVALTMFHRADPDAAISESMGEKTTKDGTLLGYTKYKDYLAASKSVLGAACGPRLGSPHRLTRCLA